MRTIVVDGALVALREWGPEGGSAVLFWHALGPAGSGETIAEAAPELVTRGLRVIAIDGPGFGESSLLEAERYELPSLVELVDHVADALDLDRFVFMGHSWGGSIAVHYAARRPERVRALVLLDSGHVDYGALPEVEPYRPLDEWVAEARERQWRWPDVETFIDELSASTPRSTPELLRSYLAGLRDVGGELVGSPPEARGAAYRGLAVACQSNAWPTIASAEIPTLLLLATLPPHVEVNERLLPAFKDALPHADVRWVDDAGHGLLADAGPRLGAEIAAWLADQAA